MKRWLKCRYRGISTVVATVFILVIIFATFGFITYVLTTMSNTFSLISKSLESKVIHRATGLSPTRISVQSTSMSITLFNNGPNSVELVKYYIRDTNTTTVYTGVIGVFIDVGESATITINGTFNPAHTYVISFVDDYGNIYKYRYPFEKTEIQLPKWNSRLINVQWNPRLPYGEITTAYSIDYVDYYPVNNVTITGTYVSGTLPTDVQSIDNSYFSVLAAPTATTNKNYFPSSLTTTVGIVSGSLSYLQSDDDVYYLSIRALPTSFASMVYFTNETYTISGTTYYKLRIQQPSAPQLLSTRFTSSVTGTVVVGDWIYPISSYAGYTIPAGTWTVYYYAWYSTSGFAFARGTAYINILVMYTNGTVASIANYFAPVSIGSTQGIYIGTDTFPGLTVTSDMAYLIVQYRIDISVRIFWGSVTFYVYINDGSSGISASSTWASTYSVDVEFEGVSNTAQLWTSLSWGIDLKTDNTNVSGYVALYDYALNSYRSSPPGYISIYNLSTTDTYYTETITSNPDNFRNSTGGFKIHIRLDRPVDWNEGFTVYIDYLPYTPTYYNTYVADTVFVLQSVSSNNVFRIDVPFYVTHNNSITSFTIYLWSYTANNWVEIYSSGAGQTYSSTPIIVSQPTQFISSTGEMRIRISSVLISDNAGFFTQDTDLLQVTTAVYGAPSIVIGVAGYNTLTVYKYISNQTLSYPLPLTLNPGLSVTAIGNTAYIVYGGNTINFTAVNLVTGNITDLSPLPANSTYSILVADPGLGRIFYFPDALSSSTYYIYNISSGTWLGPYTYPASPPIYACVVTGSNLECITASYLVIPQPTGTVLINLPLYVQPIGMVYDSKTNATYLLYSSGDLYMYSTTTGWIKLFPQPPATPYAGDFYARLLAQDPSSLYYLRLLSRELYIIPKSQLVPG